MKKISKNHNYVLIMAGGSGTRLYPRSTEVLPKQFQRIIGEKTLIEQAYERALGVVKSDHIYISSNHKYIDLIKKYLPDVPMKNYITEPIKRNTGPAIALATMLIYKKDPNAIILATHSDHLVLKDEEYLRGVSVGMKIVREHPDHILCIGINPTSPHTGFGYIEKNKKFITENEHTIYTTKRFVEKPNLDTAKKYLSSGNFFWNAGYFVWSAKYFLSELRKFDESIYRGVVKIVKNKNKVDFKKVLDKEFHKFKDIAIDHLIMERTKKLLVLPVDIGWSDIGSWDVVTDMIDNNLRDLEGNYCEGKVINIDTHNTTVFSHSKEKIIATVGLDNLIIVTTEEATIIIPKGRSEDVKKIVEILNKNNDK